MTRVFASFRRITSSSLACGAVALSAAACGDGFLTPNEEARLEIAMDFGGASVLIGAGDIATCDDTGDEQTALLISQELQTNPSAGVFTVGDNAYPSGSAADYTNCYDPSWGAFKTSTRAALGDEEYEQSPVAQPSFDYFGASTLGGEGVGYYSYDHGDWHVIVLNDNIDHSENSPQLQWLEADLQANTAMCTLAMFHQPRYWSHSTSSAGVNTNRFPFWAALYMGGVDVLLAGHRHLYERFLPQNMYGEHDPQYGIVQITVGTGGRGHSHPPVTQTNVVVQETDTYGVLRLDVSGSTYQADFLPVAGGSFTDAYSASCHSPPPPPPSPILTGSFVTPSERVKVEWVGATGSKVEIWRNGSLIKTTRNDGSYNDTPGDGTWNYQVCEVGGAVCGNITTEVIGAPPPNTPPIADAGGPYTGVENQSISFDGTNSFDQEGAVTYSWDFGDGSPLGGGATPTHTYATPNNYTVTLTVTDAGGLTDTDQATVTVSANTPPTADAGGPYTGVANQSIAFDGTGSSDNEGAVTYSWDFGDGSPLGSGATPSHTYATDNTYTVTLTVTDAGGLMDSDQATVTVDPAQPNTPPTADAGGPYTGQEGQSIAFDGTGSSDAEGPITYSWDFGDGSPLGSGPTPTHVYANANTYTATLTVTDAGGLTDSNQATVTVNPAPPNTPPTADAGGPYTGDEGQSISFDGTGSSDAEGPITYSWDFGDGSPLGSGPTPTHVYANANTYTATLTVTDAGGLMDTDQATVSVDAAPPSSIVLTWRLKDGGKVRLEWTGANGEDIEVWRDGVLIMTPRNDGAKTDIPGPGTYVYQICEENSSVCSNTVTATVP